MSGYDDQLRELDSAILQELDVVCALREEAGGELAKPSPSARIVGSILHDFYTCCERVFKRISAGINGGHYEGDGWHKELLYRMTIPVDGVRPALLTQELAADFDEYLAFRHVFRNIYGFELRGERVFRLGRSLEVTSREFEREVRDFLKKMRSEGAAP